MTTAQFATFLTDVGLTPERVTDLYDVARTRMVEEVEAVVAAHADGTAFPTVRFDDIVAGEVDAGVRDAVRRRGYDSTGAGGP